MTCIIYVRQIPLSVIRHLNCVIFSTLGWVTFLSTALSPSSILFLKSSPKNTLTDLDHDSF